VLVLGVLCGGSAGLATAKRWAGSPPVYLTVLPRLPIRGARVGRAVLKIWVSRPPVSGVYAYRELLRGALRSERSPGVGEFTLRLVSTTCVVPAGRRALVTRPRGGDEAGHVVSIWPARCGGTVLIGPMPGPNRPPPHVTIPRR